MSKIEDVISHIAILRTWASVNPDYGMGLDIDDCRKAVRWLDDAIAMLKEHEPRCLSYAEAHEWIHSPCGKRPLLYEEYRDDWAVNCIEPECDYDEADIVGYGKSVRLWTAYPSQEDRKAVKWNE